MNNLERVREEMLAIAAGVEAVDRRDHINTWYMYKSGEQEKLHEVLRNLAVDIQAEIDRQREARTAIELNRMRASFCNSDGTGEERALAAIRAYDFALRFFLVDTPKPSLLATGTLRFWREIGAW